MIHEDEAHLHVSIAFCRGVWPKLEMDAIFSISSPPPLYKEFAAMARPMVVPSSEDYRAKRPHPDYF